MLLVALGAVSLGVVTEKPGTLHRMEAWMTGGGVGARIGDFMPDGGLSGSGHNLGTNHAYIPVVSRGGATGGIVGGGTDTSGRSDHVILDCGFSRATCRRSSSAANSTKMS